MKKSIIAVILVCLLLLSACGQNTGTETTSQSEVTSDALTVTEEASTEETSIDETTTEESTTEVTTTEIITIEETTTENVTQAAQKLTAAEKSLKKIRNQLKKNKAYAAVAYVGWYEGNFRQIKSALKEAGITKKYPFIKDITKNDFYSLEGGEVYVVVPKENVDICLYEYDFNEEGTGSAVKELNIYSDGTPFILKGNISDIMPDFQLVARNNKTKLEYNPCLSLENGKLQQSKGIYDFSPYSLLPFFEERNEEFCGTWQAEAEYGNGGIATMILTLNPDTTASYKYGDPFSECIESFEGTWNEITGILALNLEGGPTDTEGLSQDEAVYSLTPVLSWRMEDGKLILTHEQGDVLLYNTEGAQFTFSRME